VALAGIPPAEVHAQGNQLDEQQRDAAQQNEPGGMGHAVLLSSVLTLEGGAGGMK
jgi:hypothetical protein